MQYKKVLTIAGSDSGGGAGIQADIKTISACGCYASSVITAVTVQNTVGVKAIHPVPVDVVGGQIEAVLEDIGADAVKTGMLFSADIVREVIRMIDRFEIRNLVVDPVMISTSGHRLLADEACLLIRDELLKRARIVTPNIPEAEALLGERIDVQSEMPAKARLLARLGCSVYLKAGHADGDELVDVFYDVDADEIIQLPVKRVDTRNTHGTGCTLSSAMASFLAKEYSLQDAARAAKGYINQAIVHGAAYEIGKGHGPVDHFFAFRT